MHPTLGTFGPLVFHAYGLMVAIGVVSAVLFLRSQSPKISVSPDTATDLALATLASGFIGARVFYVVQFWEQFRSSPIDALKLWQGGLVLYGGLAGGFLGFVIFVIVKKLRLSLCLDLFMPAVALAQGFGRIGCFLNGCCYGIRTDSIFGVQFPLLAAPVHPVQLYESLFCFLLFAVLFWFWFRKDRLPNGAIAFFYFTLYSTGRFLLEFLRGDQSRLWLSLTLAQWISTAIFLPSLLFLIWIFSAGYDRTKTHRSV